MAHAEPKRGTLSDSAPSAKNSVSAGDSAEENWGGWRLVALGVVTLGIAFSILHVLSGTDCIPGFC